MKCYVLKKDLPFVKAGTVYFKNEKFNANIDNASYLPDCIGMKHERFAIHQDYVENNEEWFSEFEITEKPPLGLMPFWLHRESRYKEIKDAMNRYIDAGMVIPKEWRNELDSLEGWINGKQKEDAEKKCKSAFDAARVTLQNGELKYQDYFDYSV